LDDLLSRLIQAIAGSASERLDDIAIVSSVRAGAEFTPNVKQRGEQRGLEQSAPMIVDVILEDGITHGVGGGLAL
jgi:hypothetical protein